MEIKAKQFLSNKRNIFFAIALILISVVIAISASKVYEYSFNNKLATGSVDISLKQMSINGEGEMVEATEQSVLPGEQVSYIPMVENLREDAYVRVRVDIVMDQDTSEPITVDNIYEADTETLTEEDIFQTKDSKNWVRKGNYFYNTKPMKKGETSFVFQGISIPENWVSDLENSLPSSGEKEPAQASGFSIFLQADAIQSRNFTPNFKDDMPWGSVQIEEAKADEIKSTRTAKPLVLHNELTFSKSSGLESNTKDLFRNFQTYLAGDEYKDTLKIKNKSKNGVTVYFKTENKKTDLSEQIGLDISLGKKSVYSGNLTSSKLKKYKKLIHLKAGESASLKYKVTLPEDSKNYYSVLSDDTKWMFSVVEDKKDKSKAVKTGDEFKLAFWFGIMIAAFALMAALIVLAQKKLKGNGAK